MSNTKPVLSLRDKRLEKLKYTHAALCYNRATKECRFFNMDNIPSVHFPWLQWKFLRVVDARRSGLTISESIDEMNKELKNVKITIRRKSV